MIEPRPGGVGSAPCSTQPTLRRASASGRVHGSRASAAAPLARPLPGMTLWRAASPTASWRSRQRAAPVEGLDRSMRLHLPPPHTTARVSDACGVARCLPGTDERQRWWPHGSTSSPRRGGRWRMLWRELLIALVGSVLHDVGASGCPSPRPSPRADGERGKVGVARGEGDLSPHRLRAWHDRPCLGSWGGCRTWASVPACEPGVAVRTAGWQAARTGGAPSWVRSAASGASEAHPHAIGQRVLEAPLLSLPQTLEARPARPKPFGRRASRSY